MNDSVKTILIVAGILIAVFVILPTVFDVNVFDELSKLIRNFL